MKNESQLTNGRIPKYTPCPYKFDCGEHNGNCSHNGSNHTVEFSCAFARLFDILYKNDQLTGE